MMLCQVLKRLNVDGNHLDELIELRAGARSLAAEYEEIKTEVPEWLTVASQLLDTEITQRQRGELMKRRLDLEAKLEGLKTQTEKRADAKKELERINQRLAS